MPAIFLRIFTCFLLLSLTALPVLCQDDFTPSSAVPYSPGLPVSGEEPKPSVIQPLPGVRPGMQLPASGVFLPNPGYDKLVLDETFSLDFEMSEEQRRELSVKLEELRAEFDDKRLKLVTAISNREPVEINEFMKAYRLRFDGVVSEVLMPFQVERLRQLRYRREVENLIEPYFAKPYLKELLETSSDQKKEIAAGIETLRTDLQKEIKELVFKRQFDFLNSILDEPQRKRLEQAVREPQ